MELFSVMTTHAVVIVAMHAADVCGVLEQWSRERPATARALQRHRNGGRSCFAAVLEP